MKQQCQFTIRQHTDQAKNDHVPVFTRDISFSSEINKCVGPNE